MLCRLSRTRCLFYFWAIDIIDLYLCVCMEEMYVYMPYIKRSQCGSQPTPLCKFVNSVLAATSGQLCADTPTLHVLDTTLYGIPRDVTCADNVWYLA
jgi:hypothetical protein